MLEDVLPYKTTLTVNVITAQAANKSWSKTGACTYQHIADNYANAIAPCCSKNSVKLHLTAGSEVKCFARYRLNLFCLTKVRNNQS